MGSLQQIDKVVQKLSAELLDMFLGVLADEQHLSYMAFALYMTEVAKNQYIFSGKLIGYRETHHLKPFSSRIWRWQAWQYHRNLPKPFYFLLVTWYFSNCRTEIMEHTALILLLIALVLPASARGILKAGNAKGVWTD